MSVLWIPKPCILPTAAGVGTLWPLGRSSPSPVFISNALLNHSHTRPIKYCPWSFQATKAEVINCNWDQMARKIEKTYSSALYKLAEPCTALHYFELVFLFNKRWPVYCLLEIFLSNYIKRIDAELIFRT